MSPNSKQTKPVAAAVIASFALALAGTANAAVDYFLKIDGIPGESTDAGHKDEIHIESFSWGAAQSTQGSTNRAGKGCPQEFHFTKMLDKASPLLASNAVSGMVIPNAILIGRKAGEKPIEYLKYELKNVMVTSYQTAGSSQSLPMDSFSLNFASLSVEYKTQKPDGSAGDPVRVPIAGSC